MGKRVQDQAFELTFQQEELPCNILLKGDSGIGKTYAVNYIANHYNVTVYRAVLGELAANYQGFISRGLKRLFWKAKDSKENSLILIEDIDYFLGRTLESHELLPLFSEILNKRQTLVVATTQRPDQILESVRSMFDQEIQFEIPTPQERIPIMHHIYSRFANQELSADTINILSSRAHGFTAADMTLWFRKAEQEAIESNSRKSKPIYPNSNTFFCVAMSPQHFESALQNVRVSGLDLVAERPEAVYWDQIGGLKEAKRMLEESAIWIYKHADAYRRLGIRPSKGLLLYGPPGTGKTLLAKAVATESSANFLAVGIPDLIKGEVGESEKAVSRIFRTAIRCSPCVIFLDELEAIFASRESSGDVGKKLISQFLMEMDGLDKANAGVIVLGATNHPEAMDEAILRPGRLDRRVYIGPPSIEERLEILQVLGEKTRLDPAVDLERIAELTEGCTGAGLKAIIRKAGLTALKKRSSTIQQEDIENACR
ncbi:P-loop containing nucleoside triphosphate hydrolase protein [Sporodiniella umbellata]|nr:P-loop containing nucleoside triphosphate hydrolase protein [Sporodiniella umbellata]